MSEVQVVYCAEEKHHLIRVAYTSGMTAQQAIDASGIAHLEHLPTPLNVGIFSLKIANPERYVLQEGDRVEIYRALKMNPKDVRRQRATKNPVGNFRRGNQWLRKQKSTD